MLTDEKSVLGPYYLLKKQQLEELIEKGIEEHLQQIMMKKLQNLSDNLLPSKQAAQLLKINISTLCKWENCYGLPSVKINGKKFYRYTDIANFLMPEPTKYQRTRKIIE